ncbi:preprotein translocase subunit YajC [Phosphitispora sp. TUW77]|uniref:preprotein translocase subunit YajC n=1 Tax=Phosphitispora sp. TUW77 TaxID=3152361 RepID=UPI003AB6A71E
MEQYGVTIIYFAVLVAIFYFMLIRPQQQRRKQHQRTVESLEPNVRVTTIGGIIGTVTKVKEKTIILKVADNVNIEVLKSSVAYMGEGE